MINCCVPLPSYRLWHSEREKMYYNVRKVDLEDKTVEIENGESGEREILSITKVRLMQYTGYKDIKGEKVFTGDIIFISSTHEYGLVYFDMRELKIAIYNSHFGNLPMGIILRSSEVKGHMLEKEKMDKYFEPGWENEI